MLKKAITYTDPFTEEQRTEEHYFHLSKADVLEMELEEHKATHRMEDGTIVTGLQAHLAKMIEAEDAKGVLAEFKAIMRRGYGKKVGEKFIKNTDVWQEFEGSPAYSELIFELLTNPGELANFINGMVPKDLQQEAARIAQRAEQLGTTPQQVVAQEATAAEQPVPAAPQGGTPVAETPPVAPPSEEVVQDAKADPTGLTEPQAALDTIADRQREIASASAQNPVTLTHAEMVAMDHSTLQAGIADGRFKLS